MENYLNNLSNLKACYERNSFEQVMTMNKEQIRTLCLDEKIKVIRDVTSDRLLASNLITERIIVLHDRENDKIKARRELLDKKFL